MTSRFQGPRVLAGVGVAVPTGIDHGGSKPGRLDLRDQRVAVGLGGEAAGTDPVAEIPAGVGQLRGLDMFDAGIDAGRFELVGDGLRGGLTGERRGWRVRIR